MVNTWLFCPASSTAAAYSTAWLRGMNSSPVSWPVRAISFSPSSSGPRPVKWVFSRLARAGSVSPLTGSWVRSTWLFTRLSSVITTAMKLASSTGSRSYRRTVIRVFPAATA